MSQKHPKIKRVVVNEPRMIDRNIAVIKPKQPFLDWLRSQPDWDLDLTLEQLHEECTVVLTPDFPYIEDARKYVESLYEMLFEIELDSWYTDPSWWPDNRNLKTFRKWFDIEIHSMVIDFWGKPLKRESFW